jgi:nitrogen fixation/metabolism regulation signal transduction histidine kinase
MENLMNENDKIVNVRYQLNLLIKLCAVLIISSIASGLIFYNIVNYDVGASYTNTRFAIKSVKDFMFPSLWFSITIFTLLLSLGTIIISTLVSHSVAGPLYRLEKTFEDFKSGNFYEIKLRPKDQVKKLVDLLNTFVASLSNNFSEAKRHSQNIKELIEESKKYIKEEDIDFQKFIDLGERLRVETDKINEVLEDYQTR